MENIITIENLSFRYDNSFIFDKLNLNIHFGEWVSIVGPNGSGKSTLIKILIGLVNNDNDITIDGIKYNDDNIMQIRRKIGVVLEDIDNHFVAETVRDDIAFTLENLFFQPKDINNLINDIARKLKIEDILECEPSFLNISDKYKVAIASALIANPKILILDEALSKIDKYDRKEILELLKELNKKDHLTIINFTKDLEETYNSNRILVLNRGNILIDGPTKKVLKEEKAFNRIGIELPFMVDLSLKLNFYGLIDDDIIFDMDEMVNLLWE
ncbi:MAG: ATP-binding cassette domain-containing protein [Bacilli bacterium]|nr:ATP-binding cassette domain-containing protein [Bacilli bacterium]